MLASGAAERYRQVALPFVNIVRNQIHQKIGDARDEFAGLGKRTDVLCDAMIAPGQRTEFRNEVRIGKKANVKNEVGIFRYSLAKTETHAGNQDALLGRLVLEAFLDVRPQLVNIEFRRVDDQI